MKTRNSHGLLQLGREALAYCQCASALISGNKALFVSVDLIGEKNQVILEFIIMHSGIRQKESLLPKQISLGDRTLISATAWEFCSQILGT